MKETVFDIRDKGTSQRLAVQFQRDDTALDTLRVPDLNPIPVFPELPLKPAAFPCRRQTGFHVESVISRLKAHHALRDRTEYPARCSADPAENGKALLAEFSPIFAEFSGKAVAPRRHLFSAAGRSARPEKNGVAV